MHADRWRLRSKLLAALAAAACTTLLTVSGLTWRFDTWLYDFLIAYSGQEADPSIVLVEVDDDSLGALGRWPWPRRIHADLLDRLHDADARGIALDIAFAEPDRSDPAGDALLAAAIEREGKVVLPVMVEPSQPDGVLIEVLPMPAYSAAAAELGHVEADVDPDGVARHTYLRAGLGEAREVIHAEDVHVIVGADVGKDFLIFGVEEGGVASAENGVFLPHFDHALHPVEEACLGS